VANKTVKTGHPTGPPTRKRQISETARERSRVARAIKTAIKRIARHDPELAEVLKSEIRTGELLAYIRKGK
jgi:hypothetical protein